MDESNFTTKEWKILTSAITMVRISAPTHRTATASQEPIAMYLLLSREVAGMEGTGRKGMTVTFNSTGVGYLYVTEA